MTTKEQRLKELEQLKRLSREEVARFWDTHDLADYWELMTPVEVTGTPKQSVSLRMDPEDMKRLRRLARARGIGATTLARMVLKSFLDNPSDVELLNQ